MSPATFEGPGEECAGVFAFLPMQHPSLSVTALITFLLLLLLSACGGNEGSRNGESDPEMSDLDRIEQRIIATPNDPALFAERARLNERRDSLRLAFNDAVRTARTDVGRGELCSWRGRLRLCLHGEGDCRNPCRKDAPDAT